MDVTIEEFRKRIDPCWSRATSFWPKTWTEANPAHGQCLVTALVARDVFSGAIVYGRIDTIEHYWNFLPNIGEVDFTRDQFGPGPRSTEVLGLTLRPLNYGPDPWLRNLTSPILQEKHFTDLNKDGDLERRYMLLKRRYAFNSAYPHQRRFKPFGELTWG